MLRPRSSLARILYDKCKSDEELKKLDKSEIFLQTKKDSIQYTGSMSRNVFLDHKWYTVAVDQLPPEYQKKYLKLSLDDETEEFLNQSAEKSSWIFTQIWHCLVKTLLSAFMTQTSINGFLRRGSMFVFSRPHFELLTSWRELTTKWDTSKPRLLDLGAGDGLVTSVISPLFSEVFVTEVSPTMRRLLSERGFKVLDVNTWAKQTTVKFDVITCLNLLDRCDRPCDILSDMKKVLRPNGIVVLAVVLPFKSYVETGAKNHAPCQVLDIRGCTFESQVNAAIRNVLEPAGYEVLRWTKLPYLCEGDIRQSYYWLEDVVFVLRASNRKRV